MDHDHLRLEQTPDVRACPGCSEGEPLERAVIIDADENLCTDCMVMSEPCATCERRFPTGFLSVLPETEQLMCDDCARKDGLIP